MKIEVKLFATLREGKDKVVELDIDYGSTGIGILEKLKIDMDDIAIYLVNGRDYPIESLLEDGDVVSLFPPVGGG